jgi:hypothetical protein
MRTPPERADFIDDAGQSAPAGLSFVFGQAARRAGAGDRNIRTGPGEAQRNRPPETALARGAAYDCNLAGQLVRAHRTPLARDIMR